jgi:hypothetical protein
MRLMNAKHYEAAISVFEDNPAVHAQLSAETYYCLLRGANRTRQGEKTLKIAEAMRVTANHVPDRYAFNQILKGMSLCGRSRDARALLTQIQQLGITLDAWAYTTVIAAHCNARDMAGAEVCPQTKQLRASIAKT